MLQLQVASLLSLSNNSASWEYVSHLEESLASARAQLTNLCKELEEAQQTQATPVCAVRIKELGFVLRFTIYTQKTRMQT